MRAARFFLIVAGLLGAPAVASSQPIGEVAPLSLQALIRDSNRIVIGDVASVSEKMEERFLDGVRSPFLVRKVTLSNVEFLKGSQQAPVVIEQYASFASPLSKGQRLLWFLGRRTEVGFDPILGKYSGDFEVVKSKEHPGLHVVVNGVQNRGLWDNAANGQLWREDLSRKDVEKKLVELNVKEKFIPTILSYGDERCQPRPIPLDLIRAVAHVQLKLPAPRTVASARRR